MSRRRPSITTHIKNSIPTGARVLVAVSGGRDSVVLLHALCKVQRLLRLHLEVCHVDHRLRSSSSQDAAFVWSLSERLKVPCHTVVLGPRPARSNMEAWARAERYRAFETVMDERGLDTLVTAHNANDVAETLLMRVLANKELNSIEANDPRRRCIRPLLEVSRAQIDEYVTAHCVLFVEDPTNAETDLVRNRIRHKLIPLLQKDFDPSAVWILSERAQSIDRDCEALQQLARQEATALGPIRLGDKSWLTRTQRALEKLPQALAWRVAEKLVEPWFGYPIGERRSSTLLGLLVGQVSSVQLERGVTVRVVSGGLTAQGLKEG